MSKRFIGYHILLLELISFQQLQPPKHRQRRIVNYVMSIQRLHKLQYHRSFWYCLACCILYFVSSGSKIVKRLRRRKYDPLIIENTICLVLGPSTALYRSFLEHCTLTNKVDCITGLVQTPSEETRPRSSSPVIVSRDSFSPGT